MRRLKQWDYDLVGRQKLKEVKFDLCHAIRRVQARENYTQKSMALRMGTSQSNVSLVANKKVDELTVNQLFRYLIRLRPEFEMMISI